RRLSGSAELRKAAADFGVQAVGIFQCNAIGMTRQFFGDLISVPAAVGQMPDDCGKGFAALALRYAMANKGFVVERRLFAGCLEIETAGPVYISGKSRRPTVDVLIDRRQFGAVADFQARDGDVAGGVTVKFDASAVTVECETAVELGTLYPADDPQPA